MTSNDQISPNPVETMHASSSLRQDTNFIFRYHSVVKKPYPYHTIPTWGLILNGSRRDAMPRVFSPTGFNVIFICLHLVLNQDLQDFEDYKGRLRFKLKGIYKCNKEKKNAAARRRGLFRVFLPNKDGILCE